MAGRRREEVANAHFFARDMFHFLGRSAVLLGALPDQPQISGVYPDQLPQTPHVKDSYGDWRR